MPPLLWHWVYGQFSFFITQLIKTYKSYILDEKSKNTVYCKTQQSAWDNVIRTSQNNLIVIGKIPCIYTASMRIILGFLPKSFTIMFGLQNSPYYVFRSFSSSYIMFLAYWFFYLHLYLWQVNNSLASLSSVFSVQTSPTCAHPLSEPFHCFGYFYHM